MADIEFLVLKESKPEERRVALTPAGVATLLKSNPAASVRVHCDAGKLAGFSDSEYVREGAQIVSSDRIPTTTNVVLGVKEPQIGDPLGSAGTVHLRFLHPVGLPPQVIQALIKHKITAISYDLPVEFGAGQSQLPVLDEMSKIAGNMAAEWALDRRKALGQQMKRLKGVVFGTGHAGRAAIERMTESEAFEQVWAIDISDDPLSRLAQSDGVHCLNSETHPGNLQDALSGADFVVGAVLVPGQQAPIVLTSEQSHLLARGVVAVDIACDQMGCFQATRDCYPKLTSHNQPWIPFANEGSLACVPNMPAAEGKDASKRISALLIERFLPQVLDLNSGQLLARAGEAVVTHNGMVTCPNTAAAFSELLGTIQIPLEVAMAI